MDKNLIYKNIDRMKTRLNLAAINTKLFFKTYLKIFLFLIFLFVFTNVKSQELDKESRKVQIYTPHEKDNLQLWFHNEIKAMKFTEEELDQYYAVIFYYISKISRLDDKDKEFTKEEFKKELNKYLALQDKELKEMFSKERFELHTKIYGEFLKSAYRRWGISN